MAARYSLLFDEQRDNVQGRCGAAAGLWPGRFIRGGHPLSAMRLMIRAGAR